MFRLARADACAVEVELRVTTMDKERTEGLKVRMVVVKDV